MAEQKKEQASRVVSVDDLKSAFKAGATPNENDYGALIDLAAVGSKALGAKDASPTTLEPGAGLKMDNKGKLTVSAGKGITVNNQGVAVKGDGKSVTVTEAGVGIQIKADGGLTTEGNAGLQVRTGAGLKTDATGLAIKLADKSGLRAEKEGLAVNVAAGLGFDGKGALEVRVKTGGGNYITSDTDGLAITQEGVKAIEAALKSVSLAALNTVKKATGLGEHEPKPALTSDVEQEIAKALVGAYNNRADKQKLHDNISLNVTAHPERTIDIKLLVKPLINVDGKDMLYFIPGENKQSEWEAIVCDNGLSPNGLLRLSNQQAGLIHILAVGIIKDKEGRLVVRIADVSVRVTLTSVATKKEASRFTTNMPNSGVDLQRLCGHTNPVKGRKYRIVAASPALKARISDGDTLTCTQRVDGEVEVEEYAGPNSEEAGVYRSVTIVVDGTVDVVGWIGHRQVTGEIEYGQGNPVIRITAGTKDYEAVINAQGRSGEDYYWFVELPFEIYLNGTQLPVGVERAKACEVGYVSIGSILGFQTRKGDPGGYRNGPSFQEGLAKGGGGVLKTGLAISTHGSYNSVPHDYLANSEVISWAFCEPAEYAASFTIAGRAIVYGIKITL